MTKPISASDEVVLYWRPGCPYCIKLRAELRFSGLRYTQVNIWESAAAAAYVRSVANGNETVPTVDVAGHAVVNPSRRQLLALVREHAPQALRE